MRQPYDRTVLVRTFGVSFPYARTLITPREPDWDELVFATSGAVTVRGRDAAWLALAHRAVWVPAEVEYVLEWTAPVELRSLYLRRRRRPAGLPGNCLVVNVPPLLRELIVRTVAMGALSSADRRQRHLAAVLYDELAGLDSVPLQLPLPRDPRALRFAELWPEKGATKTLWRRCGASRRTLERLFVAETGLSLGLWMRRERLLRGLRLLAAGGAVVAVAAELGYSSPSAFIAMFRRELGVTPGHYFSESS